VQLVEEQLRRDMVQASENLTVIVEQGKPSEVALRVAEENGCDVIVTGLARDEPLGRFGLGATVNRLVRRSNIPVLVVKQRASGPYSRIVIATDFSESSLHAARTAARFFPDQAVSVLHAYEAPFVGMTGGRAPFQESYREVVVAECAKFLDASGLPDALTLGVKLLLEQGRPAGLLRDYVRHEGIELVVLGSHGRSAIFDVLLGSTTTEILSSLPCDALVVRAPRAADDGKAP
jgi:nucleotide-binding universal stress UspA family protein